MAFFIFVWLHDNYSAETYEQYMKLETKEAQKAVKGKKEIPVVFDFISKSVSGWAYDFQMWLTDAQVIFH